MIKHLMTFGISILALMIQAASAQVSESAQRCAGCHNDDGVTAHPQIPTIAGVGSFFLEGQLDLFVAQERPCVVDFLADREVIDKCALMSTLTEAQRLELAEYFGALEFRPFDQSFDPSLATQGEEIHQQKCDRCHTDSGAEVLDESGILPGQPIGFLIRQLQYFRDGRRWQPERMAEASESLDDRQIEALAHYYASVAQ